MTSVREVLAALRHNLAELSSIVPVWGTQQPDEVRRWILERGLEWARREVRFYVGTRSFPARRWGENSIGRLCDHPYELRLGRQVVANIVMPYEPPVRDDDVAPMLDAFARRHAMSWRRAPELNIWFPGKTEAFAFERMNMPEPVPLSRSEEARLMGEFEQLAGAILSRPRRTA